MHTNPAFRTIAGIRPVLAQNADKFSKFISDEGKKKKEEVKEESDDDMGFGLFD